MNLLFPSFKLQLLPRMLGIALLGAIVSGFNGILHDQITYSISPEYFTKLKFIQFHYANLGFPPRIFASEVGFLATWWVGFISAWFLARIAVPAWPIPTATRKCLLGFLVILAFALIAGCLGYLLGVYPPDDYSEWQGLCRILGVTDIPNFVRVAYIHNAGYIGGLVGFVASMIFILRLKKREQAK